VLKKRIAIIEMNLPDWRFRNQIQDVRAGPAEAYDGNLAQRELLRDGYYSSPAGNGVDVVERLVIVRIRTISG
jgi:hypothetical protein